ncbi:anti-sigma factor family protein [Pseudohongiella spirulinae]|uniref:Putative zinc-finger domain-containing protein n=1 Tax=Pseudohongiella spirulinae TaxID=1249552 RepID=A0A0S2KC41_9GAMM|nr:zf-HC2 domain-containing protein [Pseudohongiella spirulinae]ALO45866.1 hypothetical protein PS2015_1207 [Pseudohongiella spirulinae]
MNCQHTPILVADYLGGQLAPERRLEIEAHLAACEICRCEVESLRPTLELLENYVPGETPEWDRKASAVPIVNDPGVGRRVTNWLHWASLAASCVLATALVLQLNVQRDSDGWALSIGGQGSEAAPGEAFVTDQQLRDYLAVFAEEQRQETQQDLQQALTRFSETSSDSMMQLVQYLERQRELDIQRMEAGFQQMLDSNFQTVNSVQQLASYVQYQEARP